MSATTAYAHASAAETTSGNSGDLSVGNYTELAVDINISAVSGTTPTLQFFLDRKGADGVYYPIWQSVTLVAVAQISRSVGAGLDGQSLGATVRFRWVIGGTTPSFTFSSSIVGK